MIRKLLIARDESRNVYSSAWLVLVGNAETDYIVSLC